MGIALFKRANR